MLRRGLLQESTQAAALAPQPQPRTAVAPFFGLWCVKQWRHFSAVPHSELPQPVFVTAGGRAERATDRRPALRGAHYRPVLSIVYPKIETLNP